MLQHRCVPLDADELLNGIMPGTVLVDGRVAATYRVAPATSKEPARVDVSALGSIAEATRDQIVAEAVDLAEAMGYERPRVEFSSA